MENEMMNEIITTEAAQEITTQIVTPSKGNGLKSVAIVGGIMALGALAWEFGVKPIGRNVGNAIKKAKDSRKRKSAAADGDNTEDVIDLEEDYPII